MNAIRRKFLKTTMGLGALITTIGAGLLIPQRALAAYMAEAFAAKDVSTALIAALGSDSHTPSDAIKLKAPDIAENGAVVPVTVSSTLPKLSRSTTVMS
jgi:sulfur-oxidizing protein SoxY